jgi:hypothetical protein
MLKYFYFAFFIFLSNIAQADWQRLDCEDEVGHWLTLSNDGGKGSLIINGKSTEAVRLTNTAQDEKWTDQSHELFIYRDSNKELPQTIHAGLTGEVEDLVYRCILN